MEIKWTKFQLEHKLDKKILSPDDILAFIGRINSSHQSRCIIVKENKNGHLVFPVHQFSVFETESLKEGCILKQL